jgi:hypothetical protein
MLEREKEEMASRIDVISHACRYRKLTKKQEK